MAHGQRTTVVTRVLEAGATISGKAVCEDLCFSGGSHTARTGPVRNPWDGLDHRTAAYDAALTVFDLDVLVLPTLPVVASLIPSPDVGRSESVTRSTEMIVNTCPFDVTGHPASSVPAGLGKDTGLPVGMMFVGRRFDDAMCLRVARGYESVVGGFAVPPGFNEPPGSVTHHS